jgi:hypothetical protein
MKNSEEKAAVLHNVQNAACGSCGFCTSYLMDLTRQLAFNYVIQQNILA